MHNQPHQNGRKRPSRVQPQPRRAEAPVQKPLEEHETQERRPSVLARILRRIGLCVLLVLALVFAYIFLLLGEPDDEVKYLPPPPPEESIVMPMTALDMPGETDGQKLAEAFGQPVLVLQQELSMYKSRIFDTAFEGEYARCVTITYTFEDGQQLLAQSIRPTAAVSLLQEQGYKLDASALYTMGGLNAARMQNDSRICVFAQSETAVYAIICPVSHAEELPNLLRYTTLVAPEAAN